jgi:hypothetical protein
MAEPLINETQAILFFLNGTWNTNQLKELISNLFPDTDSALVESVTERITRYHCSGEGYTSNQITRQLARL